MEEEDEPVIIAESEEKIKVLSVSEAIMLMNLNDEIVYFFKNIKTNRLNILFRRSDGNIGWLDPKMKLTEFISLESIHINVDTDSKKSLRESQKY